MIRSLYSAISGMQSDQTYMDVIGNNIANVNTTGYKASRITFEDLLSQTFQGAAAPTAQSGSVNPGQVGLGSKVAGITTMTTAGTLQSTQSPTDLAIQGQGYFVVGNGQGGQMYTRDGSFSVGSDGTFQSASGQPVLGWQPNATTGVINPSATLQSIKVPVGSSLAAIASTKVTFSGNLDQQLDATASTAAAKSAVTTVNVYDSLGVAHPITVTFTKTSNTTNTWSWAASTTETGVTASGSGTATFDPITGAFTPVTGSTSDGAISLALANGATTPLATTVSFAGLTQLASATSATATTDGQAAGSLSSLSVDTTGTITGIYSNGMQKVFGQVALATFANPQGMLNQGGNDFLATAGSGTPVLGAAGSGGSGQISSGYLEMSNVDLTQEFSNMIMAQRGYEASSRVITVSDQMLQTLVNLKQG